MSYSGCCPPRPIAIRAATSSFTACHGSPVSSVTCQGCKLPPDGARCATAKTSFSSAGSTGWSVKARTDRRLCRASVTLLSVTGIFILSQLAEQQSAFEPGFQLSVIGKQEGVILFGDRAADFGADRVGDLAHRARIEAAEHPFEPLHPETAVPGGFGVGENTHPPPGPTPHI